MKWFVVFVTPLTRKIVNKITPWSVPMLSYTPSFDSEEAALKYCRDFGYVVV